MKQIIDRHAGAALLAALALLLGACANLSPDSAGGTTAAADSGSESDIDTDTPCDLALRDMNNWARGFLPPISDADRGRWRELAQVTIDQCREPAAADTALTRADAALASALAVQGQFPEAVELLKDAPQQDAPEAQIVLSNLIGQGLGVRQDRAAAATLLERAAASGGPAFQIEAAQEFMTGANVERDPKRARELLLGAIDQGSTEAMIVYATDFLGLFRRDTDPAQTAEAVTVIERAATEYNSADAMAVLAIHQLSEGNVQLAEAEQWADKALAGGSKQAYLAKGLAAVAKLNQAAGGSPLEQYGQAPEATEAARWFRQGAEAGDYQSAARLGELYAIGIGVEQDTAQAERWLEQARAGGNRYGAALLRRLKQQQDSAG